jgi:signal peptidase I
MGIKDFLKPTWQKILGTFVLAFVFGFLLYIILGTIPFWYAVNSDAMSPAYSTGDLVFVTKTSFEELKVADVIAHTSKSGIGPIGIMRVIEINSEERTLTTKGDANFGVIEVYQRDLTEQNIKSKVVGKIPFLGWFEIIHIGWIIRILVLYLLSCIVVRLLIKPKAKSKSK